MYSSTRVLGHGVLVGILYDETRLANHSYRGTRSFLVSVEQRKSHTVGSVTRAGSTRFPALFLENGGLIYAGYRNIVDSGDFRGTLPFS